MQKIIVLFLFYLTNVLCCKDAELLQSDFTKKEKEQMILYHNKARACIALGPNSDVCRKYGITSHQQPKAKDMIEMKWDDDLAETAQKWANNCEFKHDSGEERKNSRFTGVGQNIATTYSTVDDGGKKDAKHITRLWFDEHKDYKYSPVKIDANFFKIGHYTQMVWANTQFVGCGFSYYKKEDGFFHKLYVCNYGPAGNFIGQYPYLKGNPSCQSFGLSTSNTKGLCNCRIQYQLQLKVQDSIIGN